ncbi:hypothetical protein Zm00014a_040202 [Zea mays]|nr:hypothetical protein Zm00014a_040202 [Zea mays]
MRLLPSRDLHSAAEVHEMSRGTRRNIIRSHEEYLSEELVVQRSNHKTYAPYHVDPSSEEDQLDMENNDEIIAPDHHQHAAASDFDPTSTGHPCDIDGDAEPNIEEETVGTRHGKTKLKHVWNIPKGHRIVVKCNEFDQPIGEEAGVLGNFLGMVARNGCLCSLSYKDWRLLIGKKERTTNE